MMFGKWTLLSRYPDQPLVGVQTTVGPFWVMVGFDPWDDLGCSTRWIFLHFDGLEKRGGEGDGALGRRQGESTGTKGRRVRDRS